MKEIMLWSIIKWRIRDFYYAIKHIPRNLKRVIVWIPVIWNDSNWDYWAIFNILGFKLGRMEKDFMSDKSVSVYAPIAAKQMRYAQFLIGRIMEDDYCKEEREKHEERWGKLIWGSRPSKSHPDHFVLDLHRVKARETGSDEIEKKQSLEIMTLEEQRKEKDLDRLFRHIRKYINRWWD